MSFIGKPWTEATLIKFAYAYEQAAKARKAPQFLATANLVAR
jgi:Asp-tRNA(Asn)/Glu-tRNA(Gln) amidotransferase A subunit family amidase